MAEFGARLVTVLVGGTVIELVGDVGAGKTTLAKAIARGLGVEDNVQSPSFTISQVYEGREGLRLAHYDFYRLKDAGIMHDELSEVVHDPTTITLIEWAEIVQGVLPDDRLTISIIPTSETGRELTVTANGGKSKMIESQL
jgi:tRNA threonylcarbamoyladenosine biosynthesis protein TsaE